ncbi:MAG TPA: DUF1510 family protein [Flavisolibacter sp.]|nr:DUF1510 family protein [Flavisolibacter sp.]
MNNDFHSNSRSNYRAKRKKTNFILNGLIVVVLLLIAFVAYTIFSSGNDHASSKKNEANQSLHKEKSDKKDNKTVTDSKTASEDVEQSDDTAEDDSTAVDNADESQEVTADEGEDTAVQNTVENPDWKPVGTTQTGQHAANYDSNSADWQEMLNAISSATGLDQSNMTVWFLGRDKTITNGSVGTVSSKDKQQKYRVYIQWVDGQGWKPSKVEELSEIDSGQ